jgi:prepilin signal peptidase PulO-like enzyme (type II secretory pathway)
VIAAVVGGLAGLALAGAGEVALRVLPGRVEEALEQPAWTRTIARPPALELVGGALGVAIGLRLGWHWQLLPALVLCGLLVAITFIDVGHRIIPNTLVLPGTVVGLALWAAVDLHALPAHAAGAALGFVVFLVLALVSPGGMGLGDVKLALMLGAFLGLGVVVAIVSSFLLSLVPTLLIILLRGWRVGRKVTLPFGPFLAGGGVVALFLTAPTLL